MAKRTVEEIKKAVEKCLTNGIFSECKGCSFKKENPCIPALVKDLFDLIDGYEAEKKELQETVDCLTAASTELYGAFEENQKLKVEIEKLKDDNKNLTALKNAVLNKLLDIEVDVIKKFVKRLKRYSIAGTDVVIPAEVVFVDDIDAAAEYWVGESDV